MQTVTRGDTIEQREVQQVDEAAPPTYRTSSSDDVSRRPPFSDFVKEGAPMSAMLGEEGSEAGAFDRQLVAEAATFLFDVAADGELRSRLERVGFSDAEYLEGWARFRAAARCPDDRGCLKAHERGRDSDGLHAWVNKTFRAVEAALAWHYPGYIPVLLEGFDPPLVDVAGACEVFLDRLDELEARSGPGESRVADLQVLQLLELRGVSRDDRVRMRFLVDGARSEKWHGLEASEPVPALRAWLDRWLDRASLLPDLPER